MSAVRILLIVGVIALAIGTYNLITNNTPFSHCKYTPEVQSLPAELSNVAIRFRVNGVSTRAPSECSAALGYPDQLLYSSGPWPGNPLRGNRIFQFTELRLLHCTSVLQCIDSDNSPYGILTEKDGTTYAISLYDLGAAEVYRDGDFIGTLDYAYVAGNVHQLTIVPADGR